MSLTGLVCPLVRTSHAWTRTLSVSAVHQAGTKQEAALPAQAQVVICGAGLVANSVAYHLVSEHGWKDVLVLEQFRVGSGTSQFGSGTISLLRPLAERQLVKKSLQLYCALQQKGLDVGLQQCGSLTVAQTKERMMELRRSVALHRPTGLACEILSPLEVYKQYPYIHTDDLEGAVWVPEDSVADPASVCEALAQLAKEGGAKYVEGVRVDQVVTSNSRVASVLTSQGTVKCEYFVNCAGMWARDLGQKSYPRVRIPAQPAEQLYVTAQESKRSRRMLPTIHDPDGRIYMRCLNGGFLIGAHLQDAKPAFDGLEVPTQWKGKLTADPKRFDVYLEHAKVRLPELQQATFSQPENRPDNFTPDGRWIMGETPEVDNYFVAAGMNGGGSSLPGAGGIGAALAGWVCDGEPPPSLDLLPFDVRRFLDLHNNRRYLRERIREVVGRPGKLLPPLQAEFSLARRVRCSPLYSQLEAAGAVFGTRMGFERPLYFELSHQADDPPAKLPPGTYFKPGFFDSLQGEHQACREGVGVVDMSSFTKFEIKSGGLEVVDYLQRLCSNDVNLPVGGIVHTGMQNERGGYENDCVLVRQAQNSYFMLSPTNQQTRIQEWLRRHIPSDKSVGLSDVTSMFTVLNVIGPKSKELLSELSNSDMNLHPFTYKKVNLGYASDVLTMSFTNTGEPGYCLCIPSEYALHVYNRVMEVGRDYGVRNVGYLTLRMMRIEKFMPFWGEELDSATTPYEVGRGWKVKLDKEYFIGKFALQRQKEQGVSKRLVHFTLEGHDHHSHPWPWGGEPIYRNGEYVGSTTSSGFGFTWEKMVCLGFVRHPRQGEFVSPNFIAGKDASFAIDIGGTRFPARPSLHPPPLPTVHMNATQKGYQPKVRASVLQAKE